MRTWALLLGGSATGLSVVGAPVVARFAVLMPLENGFCGTTTTVQNPVCSIRRCNSRRTAGARLRGDRAVRDRVRSQLDADGSTTTRVPAGTS
jgi:hypothetical protein